MRSPLIAVRVPVPMLARIDAFAQARCLGRAEAVRALLCNGFEASVPWVAGGGQGEGASESEAA
jgi:hypothetical protein